MWRASSMGVGVVLVGPGAACYEIASLPNSSTPLATRSWPAHQGSVSVHLACCHLNPAKSSFQFKGIPMDMWGAVVGDAASSVEFSMRQSHRSGPAEAFQHDCGNSRCEPSCRNGNKQDVMNDVMLHEAPDQGWGGQYVLLSKTCVQAAAKCENASLLNRAQNAHKLGQNATLV
eukprot:365596-Chlamydomonas_euryale.AAC.35